jgi:hypothetical protein
MIKQFNVKMGNVTSPAHINVAQVHSVYEYGDTKEVYIYFKGNFPVHVIESFDSVFESLNKSDFIIFKENGGRLAQSIANIVCVSKSEEDNTVFVWTSCGTRIRSVDPELTVDKIMEIVQRKILGVQGEK